MRYMMMVKSSENYGPPPQALMDAMDNLIKESTEEGTMVDTAGLAPTTLGTRVRLEGGKITVKDGPFTEAKEAIGGYAIMDFSSKEEMLENAKHFMDIHRQHWPEFEGETEIRPIFTTLEEYGWDT